MAEITTLKQRAYERIKQRILTGRYEPGELLNRRSVAKEFGMSTAPVHEAMLQLERDGLLEALSRTGTRVKIATRKDVYGNLIVREALETQAARLICGTPVAEKFDELVPVADALDRLEPSDARSAELEMAFHGHLVELAECPALSLEYHRVMSINVFYRTNAFLAALPRVPENLHHAFLENLASCDPTTADACVRKHIWYGRSDLRRENGFRPEGTVKSCMATYESVETVHENGDESG